MNLVVRVVLVCPGPLSQRVVFLPDNSVIVAEEGLVGGRWTQEYL